MGEWGDRALVIFDDPAFDRHDPGPWHPESTGRLPAIRRALQGHPWEVRPGREARREELERVHRPSYVDRILALAGHEWDLDPDTHVSPGSVEAALKAAGAAVEAAELAASGRPAFVLARPPGHHATAERAMGFCLFNNAAIAAAHLAAGGLRVAVVDPDVHHGNGTQEAFYEREEVFYASLHRYPFYPGTGAASEAGQGRGLGTTFNVPLPGGVDERYWYHAFERLLLPALERFRPQVCVLSAGFDSLLGDPLGGMRVHPRAYARLVSELAERWPVVATLEGGYDLDTLGENAVLTMKAMAGVPFERPSIPAPEGWSRKLDEWEHPSLD